jgi:hypothetical protein
MRFMNLKIMTSILLGACSLAAEERACDPFIPRQKCTSPVDFGSGVHDSIALTPGGKATLHVTNIPSFSTCQASFTASALTRSPDASITGLLTTLSGLGFLGGNPAPGAGFFAAETSRTTKATSAIKGRAPSPADDDAKSIEAQLTAIGNEETRLAGILDTDRKDYQLGITGDRTRMGK